MRPFVIDGDGQVWAITCPPITAGKPHWDIIDYSVSKLGYILIWRYKEAIFVLLRPDLVHSMTVITACEAIADLRPERVLISANKGKPLWELFGSVDRALNRIERLVTGSAKVNGRETTETSGIMNGVARDR